MSGARNDVVRRKLAAVASYLQELRAARPSSLAIYRKDFRSRRSVERLLQLLVESAADLLQRILFLSDLPVPSEYASTFREAARAGLLPESLAEEMVSLAGLRNLLVHEYEKTDDAIVHAESQRALRIFPRFVDAVRRPPRRR